MFSKFECFRNVPQPLPVSILTFESFHYFYLHLFCVFKALFQRAFLSPCLTPAMFHLRPGGFPSAQGTRGLRRRRSFSALRPCRPTSQRPRSSVCEILPAEKNIPQKLIRRKTMRDLSVPPSCEIICSSTRIPGS